MAHAPGTSPPPPTAPLGASGAETIKEFEVRPRHLTHCKILYSHMTYPWDLSSTPAGAWK